VKKLIIAVMLSILLLGFTAISHADSILFPYINSNPGNVASIVSVINTTSLAQLGCGANETLTLHYRYLTKAVTSAHLDACEERDFTRLSTTGDIVTFDASGHVDSGLPMFNDQEQTAVDDYTLIGAGAPNFDLPTVGGTSDAHRGYLLVNHACSVSGDVPGTAGDLDGEIMLFDVVNGASWGYRAVIADPATLGDYAFTFPPLSGPGNCAAGGIGITTDLLCEEFGAANIPFAALNSYAHNQMVPLYPPDDFQTRFFVTPLLINSDLAASTDMSDPSSNSQKRTQITLLDRTGVIGVTDRDEQPASGGQTIHVRCVAGINLDEFINQGAWWPPEGGWAMVDLRNPTPIVPPETTIVEDDYNAIVYKLEFGTPSWSAGSMINSGNVIRDGRVR
jgi:hypothetical protein